MDVPRQSTAHSRGLHQYGKIQHRSDSFLCVISGCRPQRQVIGRRMYHYQLGLVMFVRATTYYLKRSRNSTKSHRFVLTSPIACVHCRQRRVKCDKILSGCVNCKRHAVQCVYSARRPRKSQKTSLDTTSPKTLLPALNTETKQDSSSKDVIPDEFESDDNAEEEDALIPRALRKQTYSPKCNTAEATQGRLTTDAGKSHYINNQKAKQVSLDFLETFYRALFIRGFGRRPFLFFQADFYILVTSLALYPYPNSIQARVYLVLCFYLHTANISGMY